jgi:hypothetical protein
VIGLAHCKREAWVLAGFVPKNEGETERIEQLRRELGFHPCDAAQRLTASHDDDKLSAKRVLGALTGEATDREACCWEESPLQTLRDRGEDTGLAAYIHQLEEVLVPLVGGPSP